MPIPIERLARVCAVVAGLLLTAITLMTCMSVAGREVMGTPVTGDFELSGVAVGAAIALFMPLCQVRRGHIIVDFFTISCSLKRSIGSNELVLCRWGYVLRFWLGVLELGV